MTMLHEQVFCLLVGSRARLQLAFQSIKVRFDYLDSYLHIHLLSS